MRKNSIIVISLLILFFTACDLLKKEEIVVIDAQLTSSQQSSMNFEAPSVSQPLKEVRVTGTVHNTTEKTFKNIVITYKVARGTVTAKIKSLKPDQKSKFTSTKYKSKQSTPNYELESITYNE